MASLSCISRRIIRTFIIPVRTFADKVEKDPPCQEKCTGIRQKTPIGNFLLHIFNTLHDITDK